MLQDNINPYNELDFQKKFSKSDLYVKLCNEYDNLEFSYHGLSQTITPRQLLGTLSFSVVPFYYLEFLIVHDPVSIYDLGCGWNIFKKYVPNIIGIDPDSPFADITNLVNNNFIKEHQNYFESVFSINVLHFRPLSELRQIVIEFASMIKPNGRGFLALNLKRMIEKDKNVYDNYETYIRQELSDMEFSYEVFDINLSIIDSVLDGNIRMVIHKNEQPKNLRDIEQ